MLVIIEAFAVRPGPSLALELQLAQSLSYLNELKPQAGIMYVCPSSPRVVDLYLESGILEAI